MLKRKKMKRINYWKYGFNINLTQFKSLECELFKCNWEWLSFSFRWTKAHKIDHWGVELSFCLLEYGFHLKLYDSRHTI